MDTRFDSIAPIAGRLRTGISLHAIFANRAWLWTLPAFALVAEGLIASTSALAGVSLYAMAVVAILIYLARSAPNSGPHHLPQAFLAFVVIRLLGTTLAFAPMPRVWQVAFIAVASAAAVAFAAGNVKFQVRPQYGANTIPGMLLQLAAVVFGIALGGIFFALQDMQLIPRSMIIPLSSNGFDLTLGLSAAMLFGIVEEVLFRRILLRSVEPAMGIVATLFAASLQAVLLVGYLSPVAILFSILAGMVFGLIARSTGSILGVALGHGFANLIAVYIGPLFGCENILPVALATAVLAVLLTAGAAWAANKPWPLLRKEAQ